MSSTKIGCGKVFLFFIVVLVLGYPAYLLLIWLGTILSYLGYNSFFYLDSLVYVEIFNPVVSWGILGGFFGVIWGSFVAIKRFRLKPTILFIPILCFVGMIALLARINQPLVYGIYGEGMYQPAEEEIPKEYYVLKTDMNIRTGPSTSYDIITVVEKGSRVELVSVDSTSHSSSTWFKIKHLETEGYVNSSFLEKYIPEETDVD